MTDPCQTTDLQLYKLSSLPSNLKKEVEDFIGFLKAKAKKEKQPQETENLTIATKDQVFDRYGVMKLWH